MYPLIFTFREPIAGNGFVAGVAMTGRVLATREDGDESWFYGVEPGAIAEGGASPSEAYTRFMGALRTILTDAATTAGSFDSFAAEARRFFGQVDSSEAARWNAVLGEFRAGARIPDGPFDELKRLSGETSPTIHVERLDVTGSFSAVEESSVPPELSRAA